LSNPSSPTKRFSRAAFGSTGAHNNPWFAIDQNGSNWCSPHVREYVFNFIDGLLNETNISFLKWDYNRNWSEPGWPSVAPDKQKEVCIKYGQNL
jgi:hypothetical protein